MHSSSCLTDDTLVALIEKRLAPEALAEVHRHTAACPPCHALLVQVLRGETPGASLDATRNATSHAASRPAGPLGAGLDAWVPPEEFDEFRLLRPLGRGAMGVVYLGHDRLLDRLVAIKFIAAAQPSVRVRAHFFTEARAIARLQHPHVVTVFRVGECDGHPYLVSEFVLGQSLAEIARPLPWRRVLGIGLDLGRGLGAAHRQGVLHRDIKPSNVLMSTGGEIKLLDFGLAELLDAPLDVTSPRSMLPGARGIAGTPRYMAPEVRAGAPATPQSDLYSLGLVLCELCTGALPHVPGAPAPPASGEVLAAGAAIAEAVDDLRLEAIPGIDPDFAALIRRCLHPDPTQRFASTEALCDALARLDRPAALPLPAGNPYRGLLAFEAEHRALFFGRDADVRALIERLRREPLILVAGDSGAGKSSLCRAGVLPRIAAGELDEQRRFATVTLWPGRRPLEALAAAFAPLLGRRETELYAELTTSPASWLGQTLREAQGGDRGTVVFIDQLEELFTLAEAAEAARCTEILGELALPTPSLRVVLAVRGDYLTRLAALPGLGAILQRILYLLRPLGPTDVREAIVGPARQLGVTFESEALIARLVSSAQGGAGSLPLLQFALAELWEGRDREAGRIPQAALDAMGGVAGALARHADSVLARLGPAEHQAARRLLLSLITEDGTRVGRGEAELGVNDEGPRAALRALVEGRLVHASATEGGTNYQIAHETLIKSWGALRNWIDEDIGHRAIRQRLEAASSEWERLGRTSETLWSARQLDEVRPLDPAGLGPREQVFVAASQRAVRRRRWVKWFAGVLALLITVVIIGGLYLLEHAATQRFIFGKVITAQAAMADGRAQGANAAQLRESALALFDSPLRPTQPGEEGHAWEEAERIWGQALETAEQAEAAYVRADQELDTALLRDSSHRDTRRLYAELTHERILLAERFYRLERRTELERQLDRFDESQPWRRRLSAPAELAITTTPPGALATLERYVDDHGRRRLEPVPHLGELGVTPIARVPLPPGSYLLRLTLPGRPPLRLPLWLERGERQPLRIPLPATVPAGYVYVPPGCFLFGSHEPEKIRKFLSSPPMHRVCMKEGYLIARTEVTLGDWIAYLDTLPKSAPARRLLADTERRGVGVLTLRHEPGLGWTFSFSQSPDDKPVAVRRGEPFLYAARKHRVEQDWRRFPLAGVSEKDVEGYLSWLRDTGHLPGARLCNEYEWERGARGADDRLYPHGDRLLADDANFDATYGRTPAAYGPDAVAAHPASVSPFGLEDMAGNVVEMARALPAASERLVQRGGGWYYGGPFAQASTRGSGESQGRDVTVGVRLCASFHVE